MLACTNHPSGAVPISCDDRWRHRLGVDVGSTTVKMVLVDSESPGSPLVAEYRRHEMRPAQCLQGLLESAIQQVGDVPVVCGITGSIGMEMARRLDASFLQEMAAVACAARHFHPRARTILDIGGEDAKLIFLDGGRADMRMNGRCAGGTGAFLDHMAELLHVPIEQFDELAAGYERLHPVAGRCGVFAKTDAQNLLSAHVPRADVAASVLRAVARQTLSTLGRGRKAKERLLFCGGPATHMPLLRIFLLEEFSLSAHDTEPCSYPLLLGALGAALHVTEGKGVHVSTLHALTQICRKGEDHRRSIRRLRPLFASSAAHRRGESRRPLSLPEAPPRPPGDWKVFLGLDGGSTTSKAVLVDEEGRLVASAYRSNEGHPMKALRQCLLEVRAQCRQKGCEPVVLRAAATGYGSRHACEVLGVDEDVIETQAHARAAFFLNPETSFVFDMGGQDMKAVWMDRGAVRRVEINEACSSGCGSFIETFASSLGVSLGEFSGEACQAKSPVDLGSRCAVFMNSRVKQCIRDGSPRPDVFAGLAYAVIRNAFTKALHLHDFSELGREIMVQGGAFHHAAVHRAFERLVGRPVPRLRQAGLMGAFGAALLAREACRAASGLSRFLWPAGEGEGIRQERVNGPGTPGPDVPPGKDGWAWKRELIFGSEETVAGTALLTIGLPRALIFYEHFPFWSAFFARCGIGVRLSPPTNDDIAHAGCQTAISDDLCLPAQIVHGHVAWLLNAGVDRIFFPALPSEVNRTGAVCSFNCPIVAGYADVLRSVFQPAGIPIDRPVLPVNRPAALRRACIAYAGSLGVSKRVAAQAFDSAQTKAEDIRGRVRDAMQKILSQPTDRAVGHVVLSGHPYLLDEWLNRGVPRILAEMGLHVLTNDVVLNERPPPELMALDQWAYSSCAYAAAHQVRDNPAVCFISLVPFGCGLNAVALPEITRLLKARGRHHGVIKVDMATSPSSLKLRLRSILSVAGESGVRPAAHKAVPPRAEGRRLLIPHLADFYSDMMPAILQRIGLQLELLPRQDEESRFWGLRYAPNELCYPCILLVGDIIKALKSGAQDPREVAFSLFQTGGPCRASNYLPIIRRALDEAGYPEVPLVSLDLWGILPPGTDRISLPPSAFMRHALEAFLFCEGLSLIRQTLTPREARRGSAKALLSGALCEGLEQFGRGGEDVLFPILADVVRQANEIPVVAGAPPRRIGVIGEIAAKYMPAMNHQLLDWLFERRIEPVLPPALWFYAEELPNFRFNWRAGLSPFRLAVPASLLAERRYLRASRGLGRIMQDYRYDRGLHDVPMSELAGLASQVESLSNQAGEGWLIAAEALLLARRGVTDIACLQPFGCLANQVCAKGLESVLRRLHPGLRVLFLDLDQDTSAANLFNRLQGLLDAVECEAPAAEIGALA